MMVINRMFASKGRLAMFILYNFPVITTWLPDLVYGIAK